MNRHISTEDVQTAYRLINYKSTSLVITEMQIKTTVRYHFTSPWDGYNQQDRQ